MKLTDLSLRKLKHPETGQKTYFDGSLPGFGVRVSQKSKSFVVVYGKQRNTKTLGRFSERGLSLADARKLAKLFLANQPEHRNPTRYPDAVGMFLEDCENRNRPETIRQYRHYLKAFDWKKKVGDITRVRIQNHLKAYKDHPYAYFHGLTSLKVFFNWCIRQEIIDKNPIAGERIVHTPARERVLSPEEIEVCFDEGCMPGLE